ncbi:hypothetical protein HGRIS_009132 [Hohenbuehelia grisea]|uniref:Transmembrane protein n=1 Tax=Hohenbuehelia grisea TaxID=104357 RepID=A0ABR3J081_9AGAR
MFSDFSVASYRNLSAIILSLFLRRLYSPSFSTSAGFVWHFMAFSMKGGCRVTTYTVTLPPTATTTFVHVTATPNLPAKAAPSLFPSNQTGLTVGVSLGIVFGLAILSAGVWFIIRRRRRQSVRRTLALLNAGATSSWWGSPDGEKKPQNWGRNPSQAGETTQMQLSRSQAQQPDENETPLDPPPVPAWAQWDIRSYLGYTSTPEPDSRPGSGTRLWQPGVESFASESRPTSSASSVFSGRFEGAPYERTASGTPIPLALRPGTRLWPPSPASTASQSKRTSSGGSVYETAASGTTIPIPMALRPGTRPRLYAPSV